MPLPVSFNTVPVHATYVDLSGAPVVGTVTFTATATVMVAEVEHVIVIGKPLVIPLVAGAFAVNLPATDDPDIDPINFTYTVEEKFVGLNGRRYAIEVPLASLDIGGVDLSEAAPATPTAGSPLPFILDQLADVISAGAATGAILRRDSDGFWRTHTMTAADVGADPAGSADTARTTSATYTDSQVGAEATTRAAADGLRVLKAGDTMSGDLALGGHKVTGLADPTAAQDAATRAYVLAVRDALVNGAPGLLDTLKEIADQLAADETAAAALTASQALRIVGVDHGATAGTARPSTTLPVLWFGTVAPTNAVTQDLWYDRSTELWKRYTGAAWVVTGSRTYALGGGAASVVTGPALVRADGSALASGTEYVWNKTDGAGTLLDIVSGVVA